MSLSLGWNKKKYLWNWSQQPTRVIQSSLICRQCQQADQLRRNRDSRWQRQTRDRLKQTWFCDWACRPSFVPINPDHKTLLANCCRKTTKLYLVVGSLVQWQNSMLTRQPFRFPQDDFMFSNGDRQEAHPVPSWGLPVVQFQGFDEKLFFVGISIPSIPSYQLFPFQQLKLTMIICQSFYRDVELVCCNGSLSYNKVPVKMKIYYHEIYQGMFMEIINSS